MATSDEWGVHANVARPNSATRTGAAVWVILRNPGWGGERLKVLARSRGGRWIETWVATKHLANLRAGWLPLQIRDRCSTWSTKEEAAQWAAEIEDAWAAQRPAGDDA